MGKKSQWLGLWNNRSGVYSGQLINKKDIPTGKGEKVRLILRYNKFYEADTNRPRFVYCFADSEAQDDICTPIEWEEHQGRPYEEGGEYYTYDGERLYTRDDCRRMIDGAHSAALRGVSDPWDILPEDYA